MTDVMDKIIFDCTVSDRKILLVPINTIMATPYNPSERTKAGAKLRALSDSIAKYGLIQPIVITADRDLVDGNRRLSAAKEAGRTAIECIILPIGLDRDEVFREVNTKAEKITGRGWLDACRRGYTKPPADVLAQYQELFGLIGTYGIDMLIEKKIGLNILQQAKNIRAIGVSMRLDEIVMRMATGRLSNKVNAIYRSDIRKEDKADQIDALLKSVSP